MSTTTTPFDEYKGDIEFITDTIQLDRIKDRVIPTDQRVSRPVLNKYEWARLIGERATQIVHGAPVDNDARGNLTDPFAIAKREIEMKKCPLQIYRKMPNNMIEIWSLDELQILKY